MPIPVVVPRLGWTMEQGVFVEWLKRDGDFIQMGDPVFVLEGEKATQDIESTDSGILKIPSTSPRPGDIIAVGATVGYLLAENEKFSDSPETSMANRSAADASPESHSSSPTSVDVRSESANPSSPADKIQVEAAVDACTSTQPCQEKLAISPRALRTALELGVDWTTVKGTGSTGRIRESDIRAAAANSASTPSRMTGQGQKTTGVAQASRSAEQSNRSESVAAEIDTATPRPVLNIRKVIAERMLVSAQSTAPVTLTTKVDATHLVSLRKQFQAASTAEELVPTYTDILVKLAGFALKEHPAANAFLDDQCNLISNEEAHVGIAVDTPAGLMVPVLRSVGRLTLRQIAVRTKELIERTRQRSLSSFEMQGGTFTISNLGMFGIDSFTPLLNPPQAAILGVGRIVREPAVVNDQILARDCMTLSLTFDHRILDGAPAARFLDTFAALVSNPAPALIS